MSDMRSSNPVALCVSDIHWSHKVPSARRDEPCWYEAMARQIKRLYGVWCDTGRPPILMAGDLFHKWNEPVELVSFIAEHLNEYFGESPVLTITGQHDLPYHNTTQVRRSAYYGLHRMCPWLTNLDGNRCWFNDHIFVEGFGWNDDEYEHDRPQADDGLVEIAMVHRFAYNGPDTGFVGVENHDDAALVHCYDGFDITHYGDNHIRWASSNIVNPGTFMIRNKDDIGKDVGPFIIHQDGSHESIPFDTTGDIISAPEAPKRVEGPSADEVIGRLQDGVAIGSMGDMLRDYLANSPSSKEVKDTIRRLYEEIRS